MKTKTRKGFTIVELVIVIAVIGILTAILIPTFMGITDKAHQAENETFVRNINTKLAMDEAEKGSKKATMYEATQVAEDMGFNVEKITPYNGNDILWNQETNRFLIVKSDFATSPSLDKVVYSDGQLDLNTPLYHLWKCYVGAPAADDMHYSIYAKETWQGATLSGLKVGFDAGKSSAVTSVTFVGDGTTQKDVLLRTNGGTINVSAANASVHHYNFATAVDVDDVAVGTFHAHGKIGRLKYNDNAGKIRFEDGSITYCYMNKSTDANADANSTTKVGSAEVYTNVASNGTSNVYEDKEVTVTGKEVEVETCSNHNLEFDVIDILGEKYMVCRCCGAYTKYVPGSDEPVDASPELKDPTTGEIKDDVLLPGPETKYGFANSYIVDAGTAKEHWVHEIETAEQFENIATYIPTVADVSDKDNLDAEKIAEAQKMEYRLTADIDMSGITDSPLSSAAFIGTLNGNGKTISNYSFSDNSVAGFGLFGNFYDKASVEKLTIDYFDIEAGDFSGILFGQSWHHAHGYGGKVAGTSVSLTDITIGEHCTIRGGKGIAGVVGSVRCIETVNATNVINKADVIASIYNAGGLFGTVSYVEQLNLSGCENYGSVLAPANVAGLVGQGGPKNASITGCENHGRITTYTTYKNTTFAGWFIGEVASDAATTYTYSGNKVFSEGKIYYTNANQTAVEANNFGVIFENGKLGSGIAMENGKTAVDYRAIDNAVLMNLTYDSNNQWVIDAVPGAVSYTISMQMYARDVWLTRDEGKVTVVRERGLTHTKKFASPTALHDGFGRITRAGYVLDNVYNSYDYNSETTTQTSTMNGRANFFRLPYAQRNNYDLGNIHFDTNLNEWVFVFDAQAGFADGAGQILSPKDTYVNYVVSAYDASGHILAVGQHKDSPTGALSFLQNMAGQTYDENAVYPLVA